MLDVGYISIPVFILVMLLEVFINQKESLLLYERNDSLMNVLTGLGMLLFGILLKFVALFFFQWVYQFRIFELENTIWVCIAALFACDLVFYIFHALGHVCRIFWANHIVHHSSKYYNYTVGIRNHFMHLTYRFLFWSPLCLIGFNPFLIIFIDNSECNYVSVNSRIPLDVSNTV